MPSLGFWLECFEKHMDIEVIRHILYCACFLGILAQECDVQEDS